VNDGLNERTRHAIIEVLSQHPEVECCVLFGSRAMGTYTHTSDIDLALYGDLALRDQAHISAAMEQLCIPYKVDIVRMKTVTSLELLDHIKQHGKRWK
jgi:predicted nucleotidyltransferase